MSKLLIVDDDKELVELFSEYLTIEGFEIDAEYEGLLGQQKALSGYYDLVILDMMLPDISGSEVLNNIRRSSEVPIIMFTAKGENIDRIIGLESGADDYVPKPCTARELVARIRAILKRTRSTNEQQDILEVDCGPLTISSASRTAKWLDSQLALTSTEFNLLFILATKAGQVVSKQELSEKGLGKPLARYDRSIDVHISSIRQKLSIEAGHAKFIETIRGHGYQFIKTS